MLVRLYGPRHRRFRPHLWCGVLILFGGCAGSQRGETGNPESRPSQWATGGAARPEGSASNQPGKLVALIGAEEVTWEQLRPLLSEASGGTVLEEVALDRLLQREMTLRGFSTAPADASAERELLVQSLTRSGGVPVAQGPELLDKVRKARGLGERRFASLLRRNAMLRRLVRDDVQVTPEDVRQAYDIRYGVKYRTRLILTKSERDAATALERLRPRDGSAPAPFSEIAEQLSVDSSRVRGGLIGAVSPVDPSYPAALRSALEQAKTGEPTGAIALEQGYAILLVESEVARTNTPFESVSGDLEREVRIVRERTEMDRLAARLLRSAGMTVLDPELEWSWKARSGQ